MKENKGITLIALIITVVIMLILDGVVISGILEGEGLFGITKNGEICYSLRFFEIN